MVFDPHIQTIKQYLLSLQNQICQLLMIQDGKANFVEDKWQHQAGSGGGITRILTSDIIEKAGVNFSHVRGERLPQAATIRKPDIADTPFQALGVSVVVHPYNPFVPTSHFNVRFILVENAEQPIWWFGGGFDLTPYYPFVEDCFHWHQMAKNACDPFGDTIYSTYKQWADEYFYLKHRQEPRGIGGIFFDDLNTNGFENCFAYLQSVSDHYIKAYQPILEKRKHHAFDQSHRDFQLYRRGRYVEFNLLYDRGTLFGLQSGGRTESILMSLPPMVAWQYFADANRYERDNANLLAFLNRKSWI